MTTPRWLLALLSWVVRPDRVEEVLGDVEEVHRRRIAARPGPVAHVLTGMEGLGLALKFGWARLRPWAGAGLFTGSELRLAARLALKSPLLSGTVVLALATGVTLATTGFTLTSAFLTARLPFEGGERAVDIDAREAATGVRVFPSVEALRAWRGAEGLEALGAVSEERLNLRGATGEVEVVTVARVTPAGFEHVPVVPLVGRALSAADARVDGPRPVVLSRAFWVRRFGGDPGAVGGDVDVSGRSHTVVGVVPDLGFPTRADLFLPVSLDVVRDGPGLTTARWIGLLSPGAEPRALESELASLAAAAAGPALVPRVTRIEKPEGVATTGGLIVAVLVGLLVVIAGNVGNLMVARTLGRRDELAVRAALGAGRLRLVAQLTLEALALTSVAALAGLVASNRILAWFVSSETEIPPWIDVGIDVPTAAFVLGVTALTTVVAGVLPALRATGGDARRLQAGSGTLVGGGFGWLHEGMIVTQIAAAVGILGAAAMINLGWARGYDMAALGRPGRTVITATVRMAPGGESDDRWAGRTRLLEAMRQVPGVGAATAADHLPGLDAPMGHVDMEMRDGGVRTLVVPVGRVDGGFFDVVGVTPSAGVVPDPEGKAAADVPFAVVNEPFVARYLKGANAVGRRIRVVHRSGEVGPWLDIVGVVPDLGMSGTDPERAGGVYLPLGPSEGFRLLVDAPAASPEVVGALYAAAFRLDPEITLDSPMALAGVVSSVRRIFAGVGAAFALLGAVVLSLSLMGIYAILAWEAARRAREVGIRVALGAGAGHIVRPVGLRILRYVLLGGGLGSVLGLGLTNLARGMFMFRFPDTGIGTFAVLACIVLGAAALAAVVPTLRTLRVQPAVALRSD